MSSPFHPTSFSLYSPSISSSTCCPSTSTRMSSNTVYSANKEMGSTDESYSNTYAGHVVTLNPVRWQEFPVAVSRRPCTCPSLSRVGGLLRKGVGSQRRSQPCAHHCLSLTSRSISATLSSRPCVSKVVAEGGSICDYWVDWETSSGTKRVSDFLAGRVEQVVVARTLSKPLRQDGLHFWNFVVNDFFGST